MAKLAIIVGSGFIDDSSFLERFSGKALNIKKRTKYGTAELIKKGNVFFLNRHQNRLPPHRINHRANIMALKNLGVEYIFAIASTGSMKRKIAPGSIVIIDDYISFSIKTFFDNEMVFTLPSLDQKLRNALITAAKKLKIKTVNKAVYFQTTGPRYETKAEIKMFSRYADLVGMTIANEATLAKEAGIRYAAICSVDNYANGLGTISSREIAKNSKKTRHRVMEIVLSAALSL